MKKIPWIILLLLWPVAVLAASDSSSALSLTPPDTDISVGYLSNIFGVVDGVLAGTGSQLLGAMFSVFNGAVLTLGGVVILYTLFVSTLNTAGEGEVLGKRWSSVWIPLRSVIGIALLVPKASGYSFVQIFMMWVAVMGVGAADSLWNKALDYFLGGGILIQQNASMGSASNTALIGVARDTLRVLTCSSMMQRVLEDYQKSIGKPDHPVPNFYQGVTNQINQKLSTGGTINIPYIDSTTDPTNYYSSLSGQCGSITWTSATTNDANPAIKQQVTQSRGLAIQSMVSQLYGVSQAIVTNYLVDDPSNNRIELGHLLNSSAPYVWGGGGWQGSTSTRYLLAGNTLSNAAGTYLGIMLPTLNYLQNSGGSSYQAARQWVASAKNDGWAVAGRYYYEVINLNSTVSVSESNPPSVNISRLPGIAQNTVITNFFPGGSNSSYVTNLNTVVNDNGHYSVGASSPFITGAVTYGSNLSYGNIGSTGSDSGIASSGYDYIDSILEPVDGIGSYIKTGLQNLASSQSTNSNPVIALATLGNGLVGTIFWTYIGVAIGVLVITLVLGALWGFTFAVAVVALIIPIMAILSPILLPLLVTGLVMTFYIPIIPYIIFTFGVIGWFIAVIEAIIAAPLVALGIAHPEGQEILGKAEPAVILLANVFLRPSLMIFGFLIGMMLSYVGIWLVNQGFYPIFNSATTGTGTTTGIVDTLFKPGMYLILDVVLSSIIVQKSFSLPYIISDEVFKWIGGNIRGMGGEAEAEQKIAGGVKSGAEAQGQAVSKAPETAQGLAKGGTKAAQQWEARSQGTEESNEVGADKKSGNEQSSATPDSSSTSANTGPSSSTDTGSMGTQGQNAAKAGGGIPPGGIG